MMVSKNWCKLDIDSDNLDSYTNKHDVWNLVFAHHKEEDKVYPPTLIEIVDAQRKDQELKVYFEKNAKMPQKDIGVHLIEDNKSAMQKWKSNDWYGARIRGTKTYMFNTSLRLVVYQFLHTVSLCHHETIHYTQQTATNTVTMVVEPLAPPATRF